MFNMNRGIGVFVGVNKLEDIAGMKADLVRVASGWQPRRS